MCLNHPETIPHPGQSVENCLPQNWSLVPKRLGTAVLDYKMPKLAFILGCHSNSISGTEIYENIKH